MGDISLSNTESDELNRTYPSEEMIFSEYEPGRELFIIQSGKVKITKIVNNQEIIIAVLNPGDIFGEMALLSDNNRVAGAIAFGDVQVVVVSKFNFDKIVIHNPKIAIKLITLLSDRMWTIYRQLGTLLLTDPMARVYDTLLTQIMKNHIPIIKKRYYNFNFGLDELIKMVGLNEDQKQLVTDEVLTSRIISIKANSIHCEDIFELKKEVDFARRNEEREMKRESYKQKLNLL